MLDLLDTFSVDTIFVFIVLLALAIKGCISFFDWASNKTKDLVHKAEKPERIQEDLVKHQLQINEIMKSLQKLSKEVNALVCSDRDAIKAYITEKHHYFVYKQEWIDDYSLECLEKRFDHYLEYGGNSFVAQEMEELRQLPREELGSKEDLEEEQGDDRK